MDFPTCTRRAARVRSWLAHRVPCRGNQHDPSAKGKPQDIPHDQSLCDIITDMNKTSSSVRQNISGRQHGIAIFGGTYAIGAVAVLIARLCFFKRDKVS